MGTVDEAIATFERNIAAQTGRAVEAWIGAVQAQDLSKHGQVVAWLKTEHGLSHAHAQPRGQGPHALGRWIVRSAADLPSRREGPKRR